MKNKWIMILAVVLFVMIAITIVVVVSCSDRERTVKKVFNKPNWIVEMWHIRYGIPFQFLFPNVLVIGRDSVAIHNKHDAPPIIDSTISREHCMIYEQNDSIWVWNLSVTNPAAVNGQRLNVPRMLFPGDRLELGNSTFLVTKVEKI